MAAPKPMRPPPPTPKPGHVKVVKAVYPYTAQYADELTFEEGDFLYITDMSNPDWWKARCQNRTGLIPSNYVEENTESIDFPLHEAAKRGNITFLQECINNKVSVNGLDKAGSTPLLWAAHGGHVQCLKALMAVPRCELNVQNKLGDTALHSAAWKGHAEIVRILLEAGCRTDIMNNEKKTACDLARNADTAALLKRSSRPTSNQENYGSDEDSD